MPEKIFDKEFVINVSDTLINAGEILRQISEGKMEPDAIVKAGACLKYIVCPELDHVIGFVAGMKGGEYENDPNGMVDLVREELADAIELIKEK
jgi:hypothetical protein